MRGIWIVILFAILGASVAMAGLRRPDDVRVRMSTDCACIDFAKATDDPRGNPSVFWIRRDNWTVAPASIASKPLVVACYPDGEWVDDSQAKCIEKESTN